MEKDKNQPINNLRCTQFEYSSSDSDSDEEKISKYNNKLNIKNITKKIFKSKKIEKKKEKRNKKEKSKIYLSRYIRILLFFLLIIFSVIIDLDSGIIVSSYKSFTQDLNMSDLQYGSLNSITVIGKIVSLLLFMIIIKNHRKFIIVSTSLFHGLSFFAYLFNDNYYYISTIKFLTSFCKVFIIVYIPVWIDQFGIKKYKTLLLTVVYMVTSYGRIVGAWIGTVLFNNEWKKAFVCSGIIFIILAFGLFLIPQKYFSTKYMIVEQEKKYTGNVVEKLVPTKDNENEIKEEINNINDIEYLDDEKNKSISKNKITDINFNDKKEKLIYDYEINENSDKNKNKNLAFFKKFKIVLFNPCFIFSSLTRSCLYFNFQIIHVYLKKYTFEVLNYNNEITFFYYYSLTTIIAPSLGSLIGGTICNKFLGGYESKKSVYIIILFGTIAVYFISLIRISDNFNNLIYYIFGYFFSVSAFLPTISGYIINSLNKELKGFGSSFDNLITNIIGKLPAPIIYGLLNDKYKIKKPGYSWNRSLMIYYLCIIFIYLACFFKWKLNNKNKKKNNKEGIIEQTMKDYTFNRSSLIRAEKPIPKYNKNDTKNNSKPEELGNVGE